MVSILAQTKMHCAKYFPKRHKEVVKGLKCLGHNRRMFMPRHGRTLRCSYRAVGLTGAAAEAVLPYIIIARMRSYASCILPILPGFSYFCMHSLSFCPNFATV